jgi:hypothetical protein
MRFALSILLFSVTAANITAQTARVPFHPMADRAHISVDATVDGKPVESLIDPVTSAQKINKVTAVRMEDDPDHKMVGVSCRINAGRRRYVCVIDSGATNTIISDRVLKAEGPLGEMTTGNGVVRVHVREVSLTIADGLNLKSKAFVQSMMLPGVDILVGQDVLRQFRSVIFNYETRQVEFQQ